MTKPTAPLLPSFKDRTFCPESQLGFGLALGPGMLPKASTRSREKIVICSSRPEFIPCKSLGKRVRWPHLNPILGPNRHSPGGTRTRRATPPTAESENERLGRRLRRRISAHRCSNADTCHSCNSQKMTDLNKIQTILLGTMNAQRYSKVRSPEPCSTTYAAPYARCGTILDSLWLP